VTLTATPSTLTTGQSSTIAWSATNTPTSCTASGDWTGAKATTGTQSTGVLATAKTYTYTLACTNAGGTGTTSATVIASAPVVTPPPVVPPTACGPVPNCSLETTSITNAQLPQGWQHGSWGTNTPVYEYATTGHTGNRSVKLTMTNYGSGDAKWMFADQALTRGGSYRFSTYYKTNTIPHAVAQFTRDDGTEDFFGMPDPQPDGTGNWQLYSDTFNVPSNVKGVNVFLFLSNNGWVQTDDYSITPYQPTGFSRPLVSLTFDDGFEGNVTTVLPVLNSYGFKSTQCYATQYVEGQPAQVQNVLAFKNAGHEICSHTVTHPYMTRITLATLTYELTHSQSYLESITGAPVQNFASPYGDYNASVNNEIRKYYRSHRTVDEGYNSKDNFDPYRIRVQNMQVTTTLAQYQEWLATAKATNTWLVLVYHKVDTTGLEQFDTKVSDFGQQMTALASSGVTVKTYNSALDELTPQL
jgi:peptidoglycan/xylan/chitin deacetylase (PgdA/CDA1 family)